MTHEPPLPREHGPIMLSTNLMTTSMMASVETPAYHQDDVCLWRGSDALGEGRNEGTCNTSWTTNLDFPHGINSRRSTTCSISKPCKGLLVRREGLSI